MRCIIHYEGNKKDTTLRPLSIENLQTIQTACVVWQCQESIALKLDEICSNIPEVFDDTVHKAHRWCLKKLTKVSSMKVPE